MRLDCSERPLVPNSKVATLINVCFIILGHGGQQVFER